MTKWQYKSMTLRLDEDLDEKLNALGDEWWQLMSVVPRGSTNIAHFIFKRPDPNQRADNRPQLIGRTRGVP